MKTKTFGLFALSILTLIFLVGLMNALTLEAPSSVTLIKSNTSKILTIAGDDNFNITSFDGSLSITDGEHYATVTITNTSDITEVTSPTFSVSVGDFSDFELGDYYDTLTINAENASDSTYNDTISVEIILQKSFCDEENPAELSVTIDKIKTTEGFGDDEDYWYPLDEVEIDVEIESPDYDVENIEIEFCLYDVDEKECILDEGDIDISEDDFDLDENDDITTTLSFKIDPDELTAGNTDYRIYVKATGEIDDKNYEGTDETTCASDSEDIKIRTDEKFVIIDDITLSKETIQCGEDLRITADVWNIGDENLDDDEVFIRVFNRDLKIDEKIEFVRGIDSMDKEVLELVSQIPKEIEEQSYPIKFTVYDDEDMDDDDIYENDEEDQAEYIVYINVKGNCGVGIADIIISASLESEAKAGKEMVIRATVTNNGDELKTFTINAAEFAAWADLLSQDQNTLILNAGQSRDVLFTFDVKKDASGSQTFFIELASDGDVTKQPVSVNIESSRPFLGITGLVTTDNAYLWGIGILNIVLIVIIILVAVRIARRK